MLTSQISAWDDEERVERLRRQERRKAAAKLTQTTTAVNTTMETQTDEGNVAPGSVAVPRERLKGLASYLIKSGYTPSTTKAHVPAPKILTAASGASGPIVLAVPPLNNPFDNGPRVADAAANTTTPVRVSPTRLAAAASPFTQDEWPTVGSVHDFETASLSSSIHRATGSVALDAAEACDGPSPVPPPRLQHRPPGLEITAQPTAPIVPIAPPPSSAMPTTPAAAASPAKATQAARQPATCPTAASLLTTAASRPSLITIASATGAAASPRLSANLSLWERLYAEGAVESARMRELWAKECESRDERGFVEGHSARPWCDRPNAVKRRTLIKEREPTAFSLAGFAMTNVDVVASRSPPQAAPTSRGGSASAAPTTTRTVTAVGTAESEASAGARASASASTSAARNPRAVRRTKSFERDTSTRAVRRTKSFERDASKSSAAPPPGGEGTSHRTPLRRNRSFEGLPGTKTAASAASAASAPIEPIEQPSSVPSFMRRTASFHIASAKSDQIREKLRQDKEDQQPPPPPGMASQASPQRAAGKSPTASTKSPPGTKLIDDGAGLLPKEPLRFTRWRGQTCGWSLVNPTTASASIPSSPRAVHGAILTSGATYPGAGMQHDTAASRPQPSNDPLGLHAAAEQYVQERWPATEAELVETNLAKMATAMAHSMIDLEVAREMGTTV